MTMPLAPEALRGSFPPLVTPFHHDQIDLATYDSLVAQQVDGGSDGITVCGTTGEPSTLDIGERQTLLDRALAAADGRLPVIAATGSESLRATRALSLHAANAGASAILVVTPYYVKPPQRGLVAYFEAVAEVTGEVPLLVYHIPGRAGVGVAVDTMATLAERIPTLVGMKHAADDVSYVTAVRHAIGDDFRVFVGKEDLTLPMMSVGACGAINAVGNLAPAKVAALCRAANEGRLADAKSLHDELFELNQAVFWDTNPIPLKYLMAEIGLLPRPTHRLPMVGADDALARRLDALLARTSWLGAP